jgi:hypothetical protein
LISTPIQLCFMSNLVMSPYGSNSKRIDTTFQFFMILSRKKDGSIHGPKGFCCRKGKISLSNPDMPPELTRLWSKVDSDAKHFQDIIRFFNGHFSFTSLYCRLDSDTTNMASSGIYTFRAHGQIYHNIHSFGTNGLDPSI